MTELNIKRNILLNPGPATTTNSVKYAQVVSDICPREKEFGNLMGFISCELTKFVADTENYITVLFGGSGTAAIEAMLSSVVGKESIIIINNGAYGKRMCQIAEIYGLKLIVFKSSNYDAIRLQDLESVIKNTEEKISHLAVVHNETTTGLLNNIEAIGTLCNKYSIDLIVDAMSSFGAIPISMKKMNISYLASSSNKNIQGMPGVSFVIGNRHKLESARNLKPRNLYLNLYMQYEYFLEYSQTRFTPPVQTLYALKQAIIELKNETIEKRYERYSKSWEKLIEGITKLELKHLVDRENHSKIITSIMEPDCNKYNFNEMHDYFYREGITIYPGKIGNVKTFRVANIGEINEKDIEKFLIILHRYLKLIGFKK